MSAAEAVVICVGIVCATFLICFVAVAMTFSSADKRDKSS